MTAPKLFPSAPDTSNIPGYKSGLSPVQHVAVRYLAGGWPIAKVAEELKLPQGIVRKWMKIDATFRAAYQEQVVSHTEMVESLLLEGERRAAETMTAALEAMTPQNKPNWNVRVTAAMNLLDRSGQRGKAVERQQVAQMTTHIKGTANVEEALRKALRDPGVRLWLKESGAVVGMLSEGDIQDSAPPLEEEAVVIVDDGFEVQKNLIDTHPDLEDV